MKRQKLTPSQARLMQLITMGTRYRLKNAPGSQQMRVVDANGDPIGRDLFRIVTAETLVGYGLLAVNPDDGYFALEASSFAWALAHKGQLR